MIQIIHLNRRQIAMKKLTLLFASIILSTILGISSYAAPITEGATTSVLETEAETDCMPLNDYPFNQ